MRKQVIYFFQSSVRYRYMDLLQLKYFREVARTQQLSKTAQKLHIAQPSLSQTLKRLETELGCSLFDRQGKRICLNSAGTIFLKYVEQVFTALDNARLELDELESRENQTVSLYVGSASMLLPALVRRIQETDPDIRLQITQQAPAPEDPPPALSLTSVHTRLPDSSSRIFLLREPIKVVLPSNHRLAGRPVLTLDEICGESFSELIPGTNLTSIVRHYCERYRFSPNVTTVVDTPAVMRDLLPLGPGIAFIPEYTWHDFFTPSMCLKTISGMSMERFLMLSWDPERFQTSAVRTCRDVIVRYFKEYSLQFQESGEV